MSEDFRRHFIIPDCQIKPGVPTEHINHIAQALVDYRPDVIVCLGDFWDMPSLSSYSQPGSLEKEGARIRADIDVGNEAFARLVEPMQREIARRAKGHRTRWTPECHFALGNHCDRITRAVHADPRLEGILSLDMLQTPGFERHPFLEIFEIDGVSYSHYFCNTHSGRPIGGSIDNMLGKIGRSFVMGHIQGFAYGQKQYPGELTRHGLVVGSCYRHREEYRGRQGASEWRGVVVLNEVRNGDYCIMPLTLDYLERRYNSHQGARLGAPGQEKGPVRGTGPKDSLGAVSSIRAPQAAADCATHRPTPYGTLE